MVSTAISWQALALGTAMEEGNEGQSFENLKMNRDPKANLRCMLHEPVIDEWDVDGSSHAARPPVEGMGSPQQRNTL